MPLPCYAWYVVNKLLACENMTTASRMHLIMSVKKHPVDSVD